METKACLPEDTPTPYPFACCGEGVIWSRHGKVAGSTCRGERALETWWKEGCESVPWVTGREIWMEPEGQGRCWKGECDMGALHPSLPNTPTHRLWESHFPAFPSYLSPLLPSHLSSFVPLQVLCHLLVLGPCVMTSLEQLCVCSW